MRLVDTNVLLYAVNASSVHHRPARHWLDHALSGGAPVGFAWLSLIGFIRIATLPSVFEHPLTTDQAMDLVDDWLAAPTARVLHPRSGHTAALRQLLGSVGAAGNLTNDAHLAALAREHRATVVTFDSDLSRFPGVATLRPT